MEGLIGASRQSRTPAVLALTFVLAAMIGTEREWHSHACGLRPCVLVGVGAAVYGASSSGGCLNQPGARGSVRL
jgi:uncharacterized membrane protein YhiD involved in acid resistance